MHVVVVFLEAKREHGGALEAALVRHARNSLEREPGCRRFEVGRDPVDPASSSSIRPYDDEAAHLVHRELPHTADFRISDGALDAVEARADLRAPRRPYRRGS